MCYYACMLGKYISPLNKRTQDFHMQNTPIAIYTQYTSQRHDTQETLVRVHVRFTVRPRSVSGAEKLDATLSDPSGHFTFTIHSTPPIHHTKYTHQTQNTQEHLSLPHPVPRETLRPRKLAPKDVTALSRKDWNGVKS